MNAGTVPRRVIGAVAIGAALIPLNSTMVAVALPDMGRKLGADAGTLTLWLVTSYLLVSVVLQSPAGKLGDVLGRRRAFLTGLSTFGAGALVAVLFPILETVTLARVLMAAGGALIIPTAMAFLRSVIGEEERPRAFSYLGTLLSSSAAVGPLVGGLLTRHFGWEAIFLVNIPLLLLSWILARGNASLWGDVAVRRPSGSRFDFAGMFLLAACLSGLVIGMKGGSVGLLSFGAVSLTVLIWWERRVAAPFLDLSLFRRFPFVAGASIVGLQNMAMYALLFQLPFFLQGWGAFEADSIGRTLLAMTLGMVVFSPVGGSLAGRFGVRATVWGGLSTSLLGLLGLLLATTEGSLAAMIASLGFVGAGIGIVTGPSQAAALSSIHSSESGVGAGLLATLRYVGGIAGISVISVVLAETGPTDMLHRNQICFWIYVAAHVVGMVVAVGLPRRRELAARPGAV